MDTKGLSKIRSEVLKQVLSSGEDPFDIAFVQAKNGISMCPVDLKGDFPTSYKHKARKEVVNKYLNKQVPQTKDAVELSYFSFDPILNVDYCFDIDMYTKGIVLYIVKDGNIVRRYKNYDVNYDERNDIAQL